MEDFGDLLKESEVIEICKHASIISKTDHKILNEKLGRRNTAAHPSIAKITRIQAEDIVTDLVENILLKL